MARRRGRPADAQHLRMRRLLGGLANQGSQGATRERLQRAMGLQATPTGKSTFFRDLGNLRDAGWDIKAVKRGLQDVFVLHVIDPRVRREFSEPERVELLRAARRAGLGQLYEDLDPRTADGTAAPEDVSLGLAQDAISARCRVRFGYRGKPRVVHPYELTRRGSGWILRGRDEGDERDGVVKSFYLNRAEDLDLDSPGTAEPIPEDLPPLNLDPMLVDEHAPIDVLVETSAESLDDVVSLVGARGYEVLSDSDPEAVLVSVVVTFMDGFLTRLFDLGTRARLIGPPEARAAARQRLAGVIGGQE